MYSRRKAEIDSGKVTLTDGLAKPREYATTFSVVYRHGASGIEDMEQKKRLEKITSAGTFAHF
jgi:hypothetical protein